MPEVGNQGSPSLQMSAADKDQLGAVLMLLQHAGRIFHGLPHPVRDYVSRTTVDGLSLGDLLSRCEKTCKTAMKTLPGVVAGAELPPQAQP